MTDPDMDMPQGQASQPGRNSDAGRHEYPVREYIGAMAQELAQMARWDSDEVLAALLDAAADRAVEARTGGRSEGDRTGGASGAFRAA